MKVQLISDSLKESSSKTVVSPSDFDLLDAYSQAVASTVREAGPAVVHIQARMGKKRGRKRIGFSHLAGWLRHDKQPRGPRCRRKCGRKRRMAGNRAPKSSAMIPTRTWRSCASICPTYIISVLPIQKKSALARLPSRWQSPGPRQHGDRRNCERLGTHLSRSHGTADR